MIQGISHITFVVSDLARTGEFLKTIFNAEEVYSSGDDTFSLSRERFYIIGGIWIAIMEGAPLSQKTYNHVAFKIPENSFDEYERRVRSAGVEFRTARPRVPGEGRSLYFHDHDNHLFELHTGTLPQRLETYKRLTPQNTP